MGLLQILPILEDHACVRIYVTLLSPRHMQSMLRMVTVFTLCLCVYVCVCVCVSFIAYARAIR